MRIVFWGTPDFALPSLRALVGEGHDVVAVVTQPDRPAGRGRKLRPSPVRQLALEEGLPVLMPDRPRGDDFRRELEALEPELSVVAAYGHILRADILSVPTRGSINVHASLLPKLRGAAPIHWALIRGHAETGVTIMEMTEGLDEGPMLLRRSCPITPEDSVTGLHHRLAELGAEALVEVLALLEAGELEAEPQNHEEATWAPKIDRDTARIDWTDTALDVANHVRGMDAVPGAWTTLEGEPLKLFRPELVQADGETDQAPGTLVEASDEGGLVVRAGDGASVRFGEVQPPGKRRMAAEAWLRGGGPSRGDRFE